MAAQVLQRIGPGARPAVLALTESIPSADPDVRDELLRALAGLGKAANIAAPTLKAMLAGNPTDPMLKQTLKAVE
jgi:hypothetical protein